MLVGGVVLAGCAPEGARDATDAEQTAADLADELSDAEADLEDAEADLEDAELRIDELASEVTQLENELAAANAELAEAEEAAEEHPDLDDDGARLDIIGEALSDVGATGGDASGMLEAQLHALLHTDEAMAQPTDWDAAENPAAEDFLGEHVITPLQGARDLSDEVFPGYAGQERWATTMRFDERNDETVATVLAWGLKDDAVAGHDLRISMIPAQQGWEVADVEERFWCRRGVTDGGLCR